MTTPLTPTSWLQATLAAAGMLPAEVPAASPSLSVTPGSDRKRKADFWHTDMPKPQALFREPVDNSNVPAQPRWAVRFQVQGECKHASLCLAERTLSLS